MGKLFYVLTYKSGCEVHDEITVDSVEHGLCRIFFNIGTVNNDCCAASDLVKSIRYYFIYRGQLVDKNIITF